MAPPIQRKTEVETIQIEDLVRWSGKTMGHRPRETGTWKPTGERGSESRMKDSGKHCDFRR